MVLEKPVRVIKELTTNRVFLDLTEVEPSALEDHPDIKVVRGLVEGMVPVSMTFDPPPDSGVTMEPVELDYGPFKVPAEYIRQEPIQIRDLTRHRSGLGPEAETTRFPAVSPRTSARVEDSRPAHWVVNIQTHWFLGRTNLWSVRIDWTHPAKGRLRTYVHTDDTALANASLSRTVAMVLGGISRGIDPGRSVDVLRGPVS